MLVPVLLLETLEDLGSDDFNKLKWYLSNTVLDSCKPIPRSRLENASRCETVDKIIDSFTEELAVKITVEILRRMSINDAAEKLQSRYAGGNTASSSSSSSSSSTAPAVVAPAPATLTAQNGGVIIATTVTGGNCGSFNINIKN